ncbi:hypothetical protein DH2020_046426 [Rehmannia glutinosa]|uniref:Strictosidine synthase conserved region domain-containing protein n=1 Tax=Rehmannia glutinosa TaxID=99300 RepID=A0ABR0UD13_REHGL
MTPTGIFAGVCLLLAVYCAVDPFNHSAISEFPDFESVKVEMPAWSAIPVERDRENLLQKSEIKTQEPGGTGFHSNCSVFQASETISWSGLCDTKPSFMSYLKNEHICGRPLGLRFDKKTGDMYIADAYLGLMKVGPEGGLATQLTTEAEGVPLGFTNDLDIDDEGNIYFTDSSIKYQRRNFLQLVFSGDDSGRVLKYNPNTKETTVLLRNLQFPNGLSLSKDGSFFVFCEAQSEDLTGNLRIYTWLRKYWLKGEKAGTSEILAILPGHPDNVRTNENGEFWVAIHCRRTIYSHFLGLYPKVRKLWLKLPISAKLHYLMQIGGRIHAAVVKYSPEGELLQILEDRQGKVVKAVSEVEEKDGKLWMGSVLMPFVAVYQLD